MIKLVATDMDGTLLTSKKELTTKSVRVIKAIKQMGIHFVVASGRQYYNLFNIFKQHGLDEGTSFIAENGTVIFDKQELIFVNQLDNELIKSVVEITRKTPNVYPVLCGVKAAYTENDLPNLQNNVSKYFYQKEILNDVLDCLNYDIITKISVLNVKNQSETYTYPILKKFETSHKVIVSGPEWTDIINYDVGKGAAINMIGERYGASFDERMAFGDYLNDVDLLKACKHSFAVSNAHDSLKKIAAHICKSNDEEGVANALIDWFGLNKKIA